MSVTALVILALAQTQVLSAAATVSGQVLDAKGRPAVGVEVLLSGLEARSSKRPVLSRAKSDNEGRFKVEVPEEKDPRRAGFRLALWAYLPKSGLAGQAFTRQAMPAAGSVRLELSGPVQTALRVVGPDGKPIAGARVAPVSVRVPGGIRPGSTYPPPDSLTSLLTTETDSEGKGQINRCRPEDIDAVWVEAAGFGRQGIELAAGAGATRSITLTPAGRLIGRVQTDDPSAARGLAISAITFPGC